MDCSISKDVHESFDFFHKIYVKHMYQYMTLYYTCNTESTKKIQYTDASNLSVCQTSINASLALRPKYIKILQ